MHPMGKIISVVAAALAIGIAAPADDCRRPITGLESYERELKRALQDEPEDLPKELQRYGRALDSGDAAQAERIQRKIRSGRVALETIAPAPDLARLHADLIDYYSAGVAVLDARSRGDDRARSAAELETWLGLRRFFTNLRALFVEHGCNQGDVEALDQHYLPALDEQIERLRSGRDPLDRS